VIRLTTQGDVAANVLEWIERDRKLAFVDRLGWPLRHKDGRERDQFDSPSTLILLAGDPLVFSLRILSEQHSMVRSLWAEVSGHIEPGSHEMSRWVSHGSHPLSATREHVRGMMALFRGLEWFDMFSIATDRVERAHGVMGMKPTEKFSVAPDVNFCKWNLREQLTG